MAHLKKNPTHLKKKPYDFEKKIDSLFERGIEVLLPVDDVIVFTFACYGLHYFCGDGQYEK